MQTRKIKDLPVIPAIDDADEVIVRDVSASDPAQAVTKTTIAALREAMGGGGGDASTWSQHPATQDVDMDGHDVVGLPEYSASSPPADMTAAASFATVANAMTEAIAGWATAPASQDVDMDGHKITGLGAPTDAADAATKQYVDTVAGAAPTKIENGTASLEVTPGDGGSSIARLVRNGFEYLRLDDEWFNSGSGWFGRRTLPASTPSNTHSWFEFGNSYALMRSNNTGGSTFGAVRVDPNNGGNVYFDFPGASSGGGYEGSRGIRFGSHVSHTPNVRALPPGANSILHAIKVGWDGAQAVASRDPVAWTPSWTGSLNVDSVSHVEASVQEIGDYIDVEGSLTVTPDAAGFTVVAASIGVAFAHPAVAKDGQASAGIAGVSVQAAGCRVSTDGTVSVELDAASNAEHTVSFRCRYRKVSP